MKVVKLEPVEDGEEVREGISYNSVAWYLIDEESQIVRENQPYELGQ